MLNQAAVEALYSATYIENYLDYVENLPDELQRYVSRMRELDLTYNGESINHPSTRYQCPPFQGFEATNAE